jgi:hypothetical protein
MYSGPLERVRFLWILRDWGHTTLRLKGIVIASIYGTENTLLRRTVGRVSYTVVINIKLLVQYFLNIKKHSVSSAH